MDKDIWKTFLGFLEKVPLAIQHPALRFLAVFAGIVSAFLLLLGAITAGTQGTQMNQFLFVGAFAVLMIVLVLLGVYIWQAEQKQKHKEKIMDGLKSSLRDRVQKKIERRDASPQQTRVDHGSDGTANPDVECGEEPRDASDQNPYVED